MSYIGYAKTYFLKYTSNEIDKDQLKSILMLSDGAIDTIANKYDLENIECHALDEIVLELLQYDEHENHVYNKP